MILGRGELARRQLLRMIEVKPGDALSDEIYV